MSRHNSAKIIFFVSILRTIAFRGDPLGPVFSSSAYKTGIQLAPCGDTSSRFQTFARFELSQDIDSIGEVQLIGQAQADGFTWREVQVKNRLRHRHLGASRRFVEIGPMTLDLAVGPAVVVARSGSNDTIRLGTVDAPGLPVKRFRARLATELAHKLTTYRTARRMRLLVQAFDQLPVDFSNGDWLESAIILNAIKMHKANRTHDKLGRLFRLRQRDGNPEAFHAFCNELTTVHGLRLPTFHGYSLPFSQRNQTEVLSQLGALMERLKNLGMVVFANSGTLLGLVREGALLGHDDDVDLAVVLRARTAQEAATEWQALRERLGKLNLLSPTDGSVNPAIIKLARLNDIEVDLFPAWIDAKDRVFVYPHTRGELVRSAVLPLKPGLCPNIRLPRDPKAMLALNYGAGWEIPDPTFRFPWGAAGTAFAPFLAALKDQG